MNPSMSMSAPAPMSTSHSKVELGLSCQNLRNMDTFSLSDPITYVYQRSTKTGPWAWVGMTECIDNNLNPSWATKIPIEFMFEQVQHLRFEVYDVDDRAHLRDKSRHDFLGAVETDLAALVTAQGGCKTLNLQDPRAKKSCGTITITATEVHETSEFFMWQFTMANLVKMNLCSSDPFYTIERMRPTGEYETVFSSPWQRKNLNPVFPPAEMPMHRLCFNNPDCKLRVRAWDWERSGHHGLIGGFETSAGELVSRKEPYKLLNEAPKKRKFKGKPLGTVTVRSAVIEKRPSFLDFIGGGMRFQLSVAVDFTGSNGDPRLPNSLHYMNPSGAPNEYISAIAQVTDILMNYTGTQDIFASGFGARLPGATVATHMFPLDLVSKNYNLKGVPSLLTSYANTVRTVEFYGPTIFQPTIDQIAKFAQDTKDQRKLLFHVLVIITDGVISDMDNAIDAIVRASRVPMSIVIVGVGGADFDAMDRLDADDARLHSHSGTQLFDNVQFVPFRQFSRQPGDLAREVLAELPTQVMDYMRINKILPPPPLPAPAVPAPVPEVPAPPASLPVALPPLGQPAPADIPPGGAMVPAVQPGQPTTDIYGMPDTSNIYSQV